MDADELAGGLGDGRDASLGVHDRRRRRSWGEKAEERDEDAGEERDEGEAFLSAAEAALRSFCHRRQSRSAEGAVGGSRGP
jgi:hypothetical protein